MSFYDFCEADFSEVIEYGHELVVEAKKDYHDRTDDFLKIVTRPYPISKNTGGIRVLPIGIEGAPRSGKSTIVNLTTEKVLERYKENEVNTIRVKCIQGVDNKIIFEEIYKLFDDRPIQWIVLDDALFLINSTKGEAELIQWISNVAHDWEDATKEKYGKMVEFGIINILFLYQVKFKMNPQVRALMKIFISLEGVIENWYMQQEIQVFGEEAVNDKFSNMANELLGNYSKIGRGVIMTAFKTKGKKKITAGSFYLPLPEDYIFTEEDLFEHKVDLKALRREKIGTDDGKLRYSEDNKVIVTNADVWDGLDQRLVEKFLKDKELQELYLSQSVTDDNGKHIWGIGSKGFKMDKEFCFAERMRMFVWTTYYDKHKTMVQSDLNDIRKLTNRESLGLTTVANYISPSCTFFQKVPKASTRLGLWLEEFLTDKFNFILKEWSNDTTNKFKELLVDITIVNDVRVVGLKPDIVVKYKEKFVHFINVKNILSHSGNQKPTPEKELAEKNDCYFSLLIVNAEKSPSQLLFSQFLASESPDVFSIGMIDQVISLEVVLEEILSKIVISDVI